MIYVAINGDDVGQRIGQAIASDDHKGLQDASGSVKQAHDMVQQWVEGHGGKVVTSSGDEGIYAVPEAALADLESIKASYQQISGHSVTIGTGSTMSEASKALIYGKLNDKDQIVQYEPSIDDYLSQDDEEDGSSDMGEEGLPQAGELEAESNSDAEEEVGASDPEQAEIAEDDAEALDPKEIAGAASKDPEHEMEMSPNEEMAHDAAENEEDESDPDNIEADEEGGEEGINGKTDAEEENLESPEAQMGEEPPMGEESPEVPMEAPPAAAPEAAMGAAPQDEEGTESAYDDMAEAPEKPNMDAMPSEAPMQAAPAPKESPMEAELEETAGEDALGEPQSQELAQEITGEESPEESELEETVGEDALGEDPAEEATEEPEDSGYDQNDALSDMIYGHMEGEDNPEGSEENHDDLKSDIAEALLAFKDNKDMLEAAREQNPKLYQAVITMLRSMVDMAKKLGFAPEEDAMAAEQGSAMEEEMPEDEQAEEAPMEAAPEPSEEEGEEEPADDEEGFSVKKK